MWQITGGNRLMPIFSNGLETMLIDTTHDGQVGEPTPKKIANEMAAGKRAIESLYFDLQCDLGDDFADMAQQGLGNATATRLRRVAQGLAGIREIAKILSVFGAEAATGGEEAASILLSSQSQQGILRGTEVLADFLTQEIYALGSDLTRDSGATHQ